MSTRMRFWLAVAALPIRVALGAIFIWAAWYKIVSPGEFALSIATYDILPAALVNPMAVTLPWIELCTGITLILGFLTRASALAVGAMMVMFIAAIAVALHKGLQMSCGCFASAEAGEEINALTLVRDGIWLAGAVYVLLVDDGRFGLDGWRRRRAARKRENASSS